MFTPLNSHITQNTEIKYPCLSLYTNNTKNRKLLKASIRYIPKRQHEQYTCPPKMKRIIPAKSSRRDAREFSQTTQKKLVSPSRKTDTSRTYFHPYTARRRRKKKSRLPKKKSALVHTRAFASAAATLLLRRRAKIVLVAPKIRSTTQCIYLRIYIYIYTRVGRSKRLRSIFSA